MVAAPDHGHPVGHEHMAPDAAVGFDAHLVAQIAVVADLDALRRPQARPRTDVQVDADSVIGTYEYRPWEPDGNNRRKGLAIIKLRGDEAYYYLQETDQRYWDSVAGTFRASAATLRVDPPAGG